MEGGFGVTVDVAAAWSCQGDGGVLKGKQLCGVVCVGGGNLGNDVA